MKNKKLVIENLDKLKITSIKHNDVIHFKYDRKHYTFNNGGTESTFVMTLYEGRCKCCLKYMASRDGRSNELLQYKYQIILSTKKILSCFCKNTDLLNIKLVSSK